MKQSRPHRLFDYLLGTVLLMMGFALILTLVGAPFGIPLFAAGLALLLEPRS